ncbi:MAG: cupredoxin family protein [Alphaproteobacteria bacterium]|nr:cupredoxin family protein [Alphaproteobacteria bacterium]
MTCFLLGAGAAYAAGTHAGGHDGAMAAGQPGKKSEVTRVIKVTMTETEDGAMVFSPNQFNIKKGETIRFDIVNKGETDHEFVLDDHKGMEEHKALMEKFPEMEHADPNSIRLEPGAKGEIIWKFSESGKFQFACLIPGHMEAGMHGPVLVN